MNWSYQRSQIFFLFFLWLYIIRSFTSFNFNELFLFKKWPQTEPQPSERLQEIIPIIMFISLPEQTVVKLKHCGWCVKLKLRCRTNQLCNYVELYIIITALQWFLWKKGTWWIMRNNRVMNETCSSVCGIKKSGSFHSRTE